MDQAVLNQVVELTKALREDSFQLSNTCILPHGKPKDEVAIKRLVASIKKRITQIETLTQ